MREEVSSMWPDRLPFALPIAMSPKQFLQDSQHVVVSLTRTPATKLSLQVRSDTSVPASSERNQKLLELVAATLEPYTGKLQVSHADSAAQLTADQSGIENVLKLVAGSALQQSSEASMSNQMKTVVLALHNYASAFQFITPRETRSADDKETTQLACSSAALPGCSRPLQQVSLGRTLGQSTQYPASCSNARCL